MGAAAGKEEVLFIMGLSELNQSSHTIRPVGGRQACTVQSPKSKVQSQSGFGVHAFACPRGPLGSCARHSPGHPKGWTPNARCPRFSVSELVRIQNGPRLSPRVIGLGSADI